VVRAAAVLAGGVALGVYDAMADRLPDIPYGADVALLAALVMPLTFALPGISLPARTARRLPYATAALVVLGVVLELANMGIAANYVKLAAVVGLGWAFLRFFEDVAWVVLVAVLVVPVDAFSVARGPTRTIVESQPDVFDRLSISFQIPAERAPAQLGLPDVLFFALFFGAADRFGLRPRLTWVLCTLSFGVTLTVTAYTDVVGLPALPLLSLGFLAANADILWRRLRPRLRRPR
jgi:hypothetical protein